MKEIKEIKEVKYHWTVKGSHISSMGSFDDIDYPFYMIEFSSWEEMRENMGCIMEQLIMQDVEQLYLV